jgi:Bacteriophage tail sheath protein
MPEYLSPGVYVEEVERGPRPIEGVSTSTTAFVGVTRRGPVNRPLLVTNIDQYQRFFGAFLGRDFGANRYLPYAAQGFFANGGQRSYVLRVARLPQTPPDDDPTTDRYESFRTANGTQVAQTAFSDLPGRGGSAHRQVVRAVAAGADPDHAGQSLLDVGDLSGYELNRVIRIGEAPTREFVEIVDFVGGRLLVRPQLQFAHAPGEPVRLLPEPPQPSDRTTAAPTVNSAGSTMLRVASAAGLNQNNWLVVGPDERRDVVQVTNIAAQDLTLGRALVFSHPPTGAEPTPDAAVGYSTPAAATTQLQGATGPGSGNQNQIILPAGAAAATNLVLVGGPAAGTDREEIVTLGTPSTSGGNDTFQVTPPLSFNHSDQADVFVLTQVAATEVAPSPGIRLDDSTNLADNDFVIVLDAERTEVLQLGTIPGAAPFNIPTTPPPRFHHAAGVAVRRVAQELSVDVTLSADAAQGTNTISVPETTTWDQGQVLQLLSGSRTEHVHVVNRAAPAGGNVQLTLLRPLEFTHTATGTGVIPLQPGIRVIAGPNRPNPALFPEPGEWGNEIRIDVAPSSLARTTISAAANPGDPTLTVVSAAGFETGSLLRLPGNRFARVAGVSGNRVSLDPPGVPPGLTISAAQAQAADVNVVGVETVEFKLTVAYGTALTLDESFDGLSMDPQHSRYFARVINGEAPDFAPSEIVHVRDVLDRTAVPANATDVLPLLGTFYPGGGSDGLAGINAGVFQGTDSDDADRRSGFYALLNQAGISIVTVPGQTSFDVQSALVAHCERHKYSFAVLDPLRNASLDEIQLQRSRFDSTYAALYYPWVEVFDTLEQRAAFVPPSGHVAGIFARTDSDVGVFKAPANAIVNNVRDLEQTITKAQQDILNPRGINALRAFPGRGILVWGARTVSTTNPLWRYVNVRRLFIYIEESIDLGTQYAPFQINDVPLWNRLKASVRAFLLGVWRDGGLQGTTEEEAFFVRCGLGETMIGADILAGRVIVEVGAAPVRPAEFVIFRISQIVRLD